MIELNELMSKIYVDFDGKSIAISSMNTLSDAADGELSFLETKNYINELT